MIWKLLRTVEEDEVFAWCQFENETERKAAFVLVYFYFFLLILFFPRTAPHHFSCTSALCTCCCWQYRPPLLHLTSLVSSPCCWPKHAAIFPLKDTCNNTNPPGASDWYVKTTSFRKYLTTSPSHSHLKKTAQMRVFNDLLPTAQVARFIGRIPYKPWNWSDYLAGGS